MTLQNHLSTILEEADYDFLKQAHNQIFDRLKDLQDIRNIETKSKFHIGDKVWFNSKRGKIEGKVTKIGQKNIILLAVDGFTKWRVSPSLLNKVQTERI
ncbi:MAG: hypothetical protein E2O29_01710 [Deltaproteobacteria bacterium]|nr:MAG: hypothetical protein E2O29_01710 [Deltaproteobacteria bacterium]